MDFENIRAKRFHQICIQNVKRGNKIVLMRQPTRDRINKEINIFVSKQGINFISDLMNTYWKQKLSNQSPGLCRLSVHVNVFCLSLNDEERYSKMNQTAICFPSAFTLAGVEYIKAINFLTLLFCTLSIAPEEFLALHYSSPQTEICHCEGFGGFGLAPSGWREESAFPPNNSSSGSY